MKTLVLTESLERTTGWGAYANPLVRALRAEGQEVTVLTADAASEGPRLPRILAGRPAWAWSRLRLWLWWRGHAADYRRVHIMAEPYARFATQFAPTPITLTVHGTYADPSTHGNFANGFHNALRKAAHIIAVSNYTRNRLPKDVRDRTKVISNGVDLDMVNEKANAITPPGHPCILSVGALKPRKGFTELINGFAVFHKTHPSAHLVIIGRADNAQTADELKTLIQKHELTNNIHLLGEVSRADLLGWYRACDAFALTPIEKGGVEGFGLVYLEARLFGKPVVASKASAAEDIVTEDIHGTLVNTTSPTDVAEGIARALQIGTVNADYIPSWATQAKAYIACEGGETPVS